MSAGAMKMNAPIVLARESESKARIGIATIRYGFRPERSGNARIAEEAERQVT